MSKINEARIARLILAGPFMVLAYRVLDDTAYSVLLIPIGVIYWEVFRKEAIEIGKALKDLWVYMRSFRLVLKKSERAA